MADIARSQSVRDQEYSNEIGKLYWSFQAKYNPLYAMHPVDHGQKRPPQENPFRPPQATKPRPSRLTKEVGRLYDAVSFAMHKFGVVMNCHLTIVWRDLGITGHAQATRCLTLFNHEAAKWLRVGWEGTKRRRGRRSCYAGTEYLHVHVHETGRNRGFHTHLLAYIPPAKAEQFEAWAWGCLMRLTKCSASANDAFVMKLFKGKTDYDRIQRCWDWFRYLIKSLDPGHIIRADDGQAVTARAVFRPFPFCETEPMHCAKIVGGSRLIWRKAQKTACFKSRYELGPLDTIYDGSQLEEGRQERRAASLLDEVVPLLML